MSRLVRVPHTSTKELDLSILLQERVAQRVAEGSPEGKAELERLACSARSVGEREAQAMSGKSLTLELRWLEVELIHHSNQSLLELVSRYGERLGGHVVPSRAAGKVVLDANPAGTHRIELFDPEIERSYEALMAAHVPCTYSQLESLYLAEQYFYVAESSYLGKTCTRLSPVRTHDIFGWHTHELTRSSELAALAFAQSYTAFPIHPLLIANVSEQYWSALN